MRSMLVGVSLAAALALAGCANSGNTGAKQFGGTLLGGLGGALVGSQFGSGQGQLAAVALGTLVGAAMGNEIGASLDNADRAAMYQTSQGTLETARTGSTGQWYNPDSGNSGTIQPTNTFQSANGNYCREYVQTIQVGGSVQEGYGKACRQPDGSWKIQ